MKKYGHVIDIGDATTDVAMSQWTKSMRGKAEEIRAKYASPPRRLTLLADVDHWWKIAQQFATQAPSLSSVSAAVLQEAQDNVTALRNMRLLLKTTNFGYFVPSNVVSSAVDAMVAPIDWLVRIGTPALKKEAEYADTIRNMAKLPLALPDIFSGIAKVLPWVVGGGIVYLVWKESRQWKTSAR